MAQARASRPVELPQPQVPAPRPSAKALRLAPGVEFRYFTNNMLHFFYPVLDALGDGRVIRKSVAVALRVLGVVFALGGVVAVIDILKYSFRSDTTLEATVGGLLFSIILLATFTCLVEVFFYRARSAGDLSDDTFAVIPVVSILCRLVGEAWATLLVGVGLGGCIFLWMAQVSPLAFLSAMGWLLPAANLEANILGGALLLIQMWLLALVVLAGFYTASEGLVLAMELARYVRQPATQAKPAVRAAGASEAAAAAPAGPRDFCKVCGVGLVPGNTFCGNCGTRI